MDTHENSEKLGLYQVYMMPSGLGRTNIAPLFLVSCRLGALLLYLLYLRRYIPIQTVIVSDTRDIPSVLDSAFVSMVTKGGPGSGS